MRTRLLTAMAVALWLAGCGGDGGAPSADPAGRVLPGRGPVLSAADARARVLSQYLGVTTSRQVSPGQPHLGTAADPAVDVCELPGGPFPAGTRVRSAEPGAATTVLNGVYHLFWVDRQPHALLGHACYIVYVAADDGRIIEQPALFDPALGDTRPLRTRTRQAAQRIYRTPLTDILRALAEGQSPVAPPRAGRQIAGADAGGLVVTGEPDSPGLNDTGKPTDPDVDSMTDQARDLYQRINGTEEGLDELHDSAEESQGITPEKLARALRDASAGLGPDDKFFLFIGGHAYSGGIFLGLKLYPWAELCEMIESNVTAGHVNLIMQACNAGAFAQVLPAWDQASSKGVRFIGTTDATHITVGLFALRCILAKLGDLTDAAREGDDELTVAELEAAWAEVSVSAEEIAEKHDEHVRDWPDLSDEARDRLRDRYRDEPNGPVTVGGFPAD